MKKQKKGGNTTIILCGILAICIAVALIPVFNKKKNQPVTVYPVYFNGRNIGTVLEPADAEKLSLQARKELSKASGNMILVETEVTVGEGIEAESATENSMLKANMKQIILNDVIQKPEKSYTVKLNDYMVNVKDKDDIQMLLQAVINKYDEEQTFEVLLSQDRNRDIPVITADVQKKSDGDVADLKKQSTEAGFSATFKDYYNKAEIEKEKEFEDYELGISTMNFTEKVEVVESYVPVSQVKSLQEAIEEVTKEEETQTIYKVQPGDTLSEIAIKVDIPMDRIVELNDSLENTSSMIHVDQELIVTVPEPEVSVFRSEVNYYEEIYDAPIVFVDRDDWYTNQTKVVQQPSAGFRKIVAKEDYLNDSLQSREILKEEVVMEAVEKIVERGTKIPPTYIKPINGGRQTSGFGKRKAPTKGASTYHKGVDWAVPTGTSVYASCGGKVSKAGWGSGYGNVIYIDHEDGRQTRYGHLSKILVSVGDKVKQGDKIALSGNTGVSTGPHLHFEILIDGTQVNPLNYLD